MTDATVETSYVVHIASRYSSHRYIPVMGYSYEINGQRYSGSFGLEDASRPDQEAAEEIGGSWRSRKIRVRFNPQKPEKSAFLRDDGAPANTMSYADQPPDSTDVITLALK